jgi:hypothetical protein
LKGRWSGAATVRVMVVRIPRGDDKMWMILTEEISWPQGQGSGSASRVEKTRRGGVNGTGGMETKLTCGRAMFVNTLAEGKLMSESVQSAQSG